MLSRTALPLLVLACALAPGLPRVALAQTTAAVDAPPADTAEQSAEHARLSDELAKLAKRQVWSGVEKKFHDLEALGVPLTLDDYVYGAYAAREIGDVSAAYTRLQAAARLGGSKEIVDWLWDIDHNYGHVELIMVPARGAILESDEMPMDPNQRKAVETAMASAKSDGIYAGMLPKGGYVFAGQPFTVEPGVNVRIEVSPKVRRKGPIDPVIRWPTAPMENKAPATTTPPPPPPPAPTPE